MDKDLVSIIMPTYNCGKFISESIQSIVSQTYKNWELIIQDDCSTDDTKEIVDRFGNDSRIRYYSNEVNSGAAISRNRAIMKANGRWIAFLDSDDLWYPEKLAKQISFMEKNNYSFSYHNYIEINEASKEIGILVSGIHKVGKFSMYSCCWPGCLSVMYDAEKIGLVQIVDIKKNNDSAMWLKIIKKANCYLLDETLGLYRRRKGSITPLNIKARIGWHYTLFRTAQNMNPVFSAFWMCINVLGNSIKKICYVKKYSVEK